MFCKSCERPLTKGDIYIKFEDERYCFDCYDSHTLTHYTVGDYLGTDDDGVAEYGPWNIEEEEQGKI